MEKETRELHEVLKSFFSRNRTFENHVLEVCKGLFAQDYKISCVKNSGELLLCDSYPAELVLMEYSRPMDSQDEETESIYKTREMWDLFNAGRFSRCRARFPVPVIQIFGKYICRSATLYTSAEMLGRSGFDYFLSTNSGFGSSSSISDFSASESQLDRMRRADQEILRQFQVESICDLMVEMKKVKYGLHVSSSEKADKHSRYSEFSILCLPYPGCEFFRDWRDNSYNGQNLIYNWNQDQEDVFLDIPISVRRLVPVSWPHYTGWDLVTLTCNYLKLLLRFIQNTDKGVLVHCISGWDRTPLMISLLRLSLWADGLIHQSLSIFEITYLTVAYDWLLFGHNLQDRFARGEEIMLFCFYMLKFVAGEEFSLFSNFADQLDTSVGFSGERNSSISSFVDVGPELPARPASACASESVSIPRGGAGFDADPFETRRSAVAAEPECGSWQLIGAESSSVLLANLRQRDSPLICAAGSGGGAGSENGNRSMDDDPAQQLTPTVQRRRRRTPSLEIDRRTRLMGVSQLFYRVYSSAVPSTEIVERSPSGGGGLGSVLGQLVGRMGLSRVLTKAPAS